MNKMTVFIAVIFSFYTTTAIGQGQRVYGGYTTPKIDDEIQWIEETVSPESYIGQIFLVKKDNSTIPFFAPIAIKSLAQEEPSIKKSILIKAAEDGSISLGNIFTIRGQTEKVFQFQIVNSKRWSADTKSSDYLKAISNFRNDPSTAPLFDSGDFAGIVMVTGVIERKIWYKAFSKKSWNGSGTYFVKIEGKAYESSEDYEEVIKYGLIIRPINGFGYILPKAVVSSQQINEISEKAVITPIISQNILQAAENLNTSP